MAKSKGKETLSAARLRESLEYNSASGDFAWKVDRRRVRAGARAGSVHLKGYLTIRIDGRSYLCHRLAWLYVHGRWPVDQIDHINGNRSDNRISNLREATNAQNCQNVRAHRDGQGLVGVSLERRSGQWVAGIGFNGRRRHLGSFETKDAAHAAYLKAKLAIHNFSGGNNGH